MPEYIGEIISTKNFVYRHFRRNVIGKKPKYRDILAENVDEMPIGIPKFRFVEPVLYNSIAYCIMYVCYVL